MKNVKPYYFMAAFAAIFAAIAYWFYKRNHSNTQEALPAVKLPVISDALPIIDSAGNPPPYNALDPLPAPYSPPVVWLPATTKSLTLGGNDGIMPADVALTSLSGKSLQLKQNAGDFLTGSVLNF